MDSISKNGPLPELDGFVDVELLIAESKRLQESLSQKIAKAQELVLAEKTHPRTPGEHRIAMLSTGIAGALTMRADSSIELQQNGQKILNFTISLIHEELSKLVTISKGLHTILSDVFKDLENHTSGKTQSLVRNLQNLLQRTKTETATEEAADIFGKTIPMFSIYKGKVRVPPPLSQTSRPLGTVTPAKAEKAFSQLRPTAPTSPHASLSLRPVVLSSAPAQKSAEDLINELLTGHPVLEEKEINTLLKQSLSLLLDPKADELFLKTLKRPCALGYFAAKVLDRIPVIPAELRQSPILGMLYTEAALFFLEVTPVLLDDLTAREVTHSEDKTKLLAISQEIRLLLSLAKIYANLGQVFVGTTFAFIHTLELASQFDKAALAHVNLTPDDFRKCSAQFRLQPAESTDDLESVVKALKKNETNYYLGKRVDDSSALVFLLTRLIEIKNEIFTVYSTSKGTLRDGARETLKKVNDGLYRAVKAQFQMIFSKDQRYSHFIKHLKGAPTHSHSLLKLRISTSNPDFNPLKEHIDAKKTAIERAEFDRLKSAAYSFEKHNYSQFSRPTQSRLGKWWPSESVRFDEDLSPSPADSACSCNAAVALIYSLTPDRVFAFDQVLDEGQYVYYKVLDGKPEVEGDATSGYYLHIREDVDPIISRLGHLRHEGEFLTGFLTEGEEAKVYKDLFAQLAQKIEGAAGKIGGFIQNGVNIYALTVEKTDEGQFLYTIIDSHGLSHSVPTVEKDYDRAFRISFKSIDDAASFLALHPPHSGEPSQQINSVTILPVRGTEIDLSHFAHRGDDILSEAGAYALDLKDKRRAKEVQDRQTLDKAGRLPKDL